jgi:hypothetical protein
VSGSREKRRAIEYALGGVTVVLSTVACIVASPALGVVALTTGAVGFGMLIGDG